MAEPKILTAAVLTTHALPFTTNANNLMQQAERAQVVDIESFERAVDHIKICGSQHTSAEDARKALTAPLNNHVKWINDQFRPITDLLNKAKKLMKEKGGKWKSEEDARVAAKEKQQREAAEEQAIKDAEEAIESGDSDKADAIIDAAAATPKGETKAPTGRGEWTGASGSIRKTWVGEVHDVQQVCDAIGRGFLPGSIVKEFSKKSMNEFAKLTGVEGKKFGIRITEKKEMTVK